MRLEMTGHNNTILKLIDKIRNESHVDKRAEILRLINSLLPDAIKLDIPSLITNDYVNFAIYKIEQSLLVA
jgi:hypothetical protein